ncbi:MAG: flavodoxin family protein [Nitrospirota bacterium]|nr:flavodoxin family protein [Nitrospirota bacterium]
MKVVAFFGSPRIEGNTDILLQEALKPVQAGGHEVIEFRLNLLNIKPCQDCGGCTKTGVCVINDAMKDIYEAIRTADRFILASPIFFYTVSAQAKAMIDRCQAFWCEKYLLKKDIPAGPHGRKGLLLVAAGMNKDAAVQCADTVARIFFRTISVPEHVMVSALGADGKGDVLKNSAVLKEAYEAGKKLIS